MPNPGRRGAQPKDDPEPPLFVRSFIDFFGDIGPRWGLPADACRIHAYLYLAGAPVSCGELAGKLLLDQAALEAGLGFLRDFKMIQPHSSDGWRTGSDPWDMLVGALEERRRRELAPALATLRACRSQALTGDGTDKAMGERIGRLVALVEDLEAIDAQARRLPSGLVRGLVTLSGRAARLVGRKRV